MKDAVMLQGAVSRRFCHPRTRTGAMKSPSTDFAVNGRVEMNKIGHNGIERRLPPPGRLCPLESGSPWTLWLVFSFSTIVRVPVGFCHVLTWLEESTCEVGVRTPIPATNEFVRETCQAVLFQSEDGRERAREEDPLRRPRRRRGARFRNGILGSNSVKKYNSRGSSVSVRPQTSDALPLVALGLSEADLRRDDLRRLTSATAIGWRA